MNEPKAYLKHRNKLDKTFRFLFRPTIIGAENIPEDGRIILAGNHTHFMDCITVAASTKRVVHFLAKSELLEPPYKRYFEPFGIIPRTHAANPSYQWGLFGESLFVMRPSPPLQTSHHPLSWLQLLHQTPVSYRAATDFRNYSCNEL